MKKIHSKYVQLIFIAVAFCLTGCEDFLDKNPDMRTEVNSVDKVAQLVASAYPSYNYLAINETVSDNVSDKGPGREHNDDPYVSLYFWRDIANAANNTPAGYWNGVYEGIAAANQALESIEKYDLGPKALPYKGEALVARAYGHFMLVTLFAKTYEPGKPNNSPGIPYMTTPEKTALAKYGRGTVASVYEQIEKDLTEGLLLLKGGQWQVPKYHFTYSSANAFAARFYLFKGEFDKVIAHTNEIFPDGNFEGNLRPENTVFRTYTPEQYKQELTMADKNYNLLLRETRSLYQRGGSSGLARYGFGADKLYNVYNAQTVAGARFLNHAGGYNTDSYLVNKWNEYIHVTDIQTGSGFAYVMMPLFTADEALINRAEAYIQEENYTTALADINYFASVRLENYNSSTHTVTLQKAKDFFGVTDDKEALIKTVLQFKQIAFMGEGMRWFDLLRHRLPVVHNHIDASGAETFSTLGPDDNRRMFQIPQDATLAGIQLNPR